VGKSVAVSRQQVTTRDVVALLVPGLTARGVTPSRETVGLFLALIWNESGRGKLTCWSPGNLAAAGFANGKEVFFWPGDFWRPPWFNDPKSAIHTLMLDGKEPSAFQAYGSLKEGLEHFVKLVTSPMYTTLAAAAATGDPGKFAQAIRDSRYTPRLDVAGATKTLGSLYAEFQKSGVLDSIATGETPMPTPALILTKEDVLTAPKNEAPLFILRKGVSGALVALWQTLLNGELAVSVAVTGDFDDATETATKAWQEKQGLPADGIAGPKTWSAFFT
jgi:peptidoglycan hydrolase-like protein with peptidoglycan-binding domain